MTGETRPAATLVDSLAETAALGVPTMAALVSAATVGVIIVDRHRRFVYANPAARRLLGTEHEQPDVTDVLDNFAARDHAKVLAGFVARPGQSTANFAGTLLGADGDEREVVCSTFPIDLDGSPHGVAIIWDFTGPRETARTALALAQTAAQLVGEGDASAILTALARHAVEGSAALSCGISVVGEDHTLAAAGAYGPPGPGYGHANPAWAALADTPVEAVIEAMTVGTMTFTDPPGAPTIVTDARTSWETNPITAPFAANLGTLDWRGGVYVPLSWQHTVIGFFAIFLPSTVDAPSEDDLALYRALADQAAVVVMNGRLEAQARTAAVLDERSKLARGLHDSVSQGLFSMRMHARAAQLSLAGAGIAAEDPLARSIAQLTELTRGALAEMRALVFELRPGALTEEGLVEALRRVGVSLSESAPMTIDVHGPQGDLELSLDAEENLYRIATEALNNIAKHAEATCATVRITASPEWLTMTVTDDGVGFDASAAFPGHLGMSTMAQRATSIGAGYTLTSAPGTGTTVTVTLPRLSGSGRRGPT